MLSFTDLGLMFLPSFCSNPTRPCKWGCLLTWQWSEIFVKHKTGNTDVKCWILNCNTKTVTFEHFKHKGSVWLKGKLIMESLYSHLFILKCWHICFYNDEFVKSTWCFAMGFKGQEDSTGDFKANKQSKCGV